MVEWRHVPNATIMIVEHAGLSAFTILRGRIARGRRGRCACWWHASARAVRQKTGYPPGRTGFEPVPQAKAAERLAIMAQTTDGFRIAEADLRQRGPGEIFGTRQHGLPELRVGNLVQDFGLLEKARQDAFDLIRRDPKLERPEHQGLLPRLRRMFGGKLARSTRPNGATTAKHAPKVETNLPGHISPVGAGLIQLTEPCLNNTRD